MSEVEIKIKLTGLPESIIDRLEAVLDDYLPNSDDSDIIPPKVGERKPRPSTLERSAKLKLKIAKNDEGDLIRVIKKEKKVIRLDEAQAYVDSVCERIKAWLEFYFPDDNNGEPLTLTLKVIMQPLHMNTDAPAKSYVEIEEKV